MTTLSDVAHLMASRFAPRASWQDPDRKLVPSLPAIFLHFLRRIYASACHHLITPLLSNNAVKRKKALQNILVILGMFLFLFLTSVSKNLSSTGVDYEMLRGAQAVSKKELCLQRLPSVDVEVGSVLNGTLLFHVSFTEEQKSADVVTFAEVARRRRELQKNSRTSESGQDMTQSLSGATLGRNSRTNSGRATSPRSNQIRSPLSVRSSFEGGRGYETVYARTRSRQKNRAKNVQGNDYIRKIDSYRTEVDFKTAKNDTGASVKRVEGGDQMYFSDYVMKGSKNGARAYKRLIKSKAEPTQRTSVSEVNQPNLKLHSQNDDFITRGSRTYLFDDVVVTSRSWEPITDNDQNLFVYSAFYDDRPSTEGDDKRRVRVLGISVLHELRDFPHLRTQVFCHYRWKTSPNLHVSQRGRIVSIPEDHNKRYHAVFIICELHLCGSPDYVGITVERDVLPLSYLPVKYPVMNGQSFKHNFTTCFPVMHSRYSNNLELLQVLEADKSFGAEKFTLYLHSASPEVLAIIRHYVTSGVMEAVEWRLPFTDVSLVHYFGQMAAINDCLYNSQYTSRYVVFHDFDELLFPRMHDTWNQMLEEIQLQEETIAMKWRQWLRGQYGSYTFMHVCFPKNWTHPGLPGDAVIEGSDVEVQPGEVQPFVYGYVISLPSDTDEIGDKYPDRNRSVSFDAYRNKSGKADAGDSVTNVGSVALGSKSRHRPGSLLHEAADDAKSGGLGNTWSEPHAALPSHSDVDSSPSRLDNDDDDTLPALRYTWRENLVWAPEARSKMLVKPATVEMMGIHNVHMHVKGYQSKNLAAEMALVHHYRIWWVRNGTAMIHDTTAHRLATRLTANVQHILSKVLGVQLNKEN